jgi:murein DD-endopeptidase MepM/ murein hydrolase activator NlpD
MHARRATTIMAALRAAGLLAAAAPLCAAGTDAAPATIVVSARLRQGDPLLAWIVTEAQVAASPIGDAATADSSGRGLEARLVDAAGRTVESSLCFDASELLDRGGGPLAPAPETPPAVRVKRTLLGALMPIPVALPPGDYELVAAGASASVAVGPRSFPLETIRLDEANSKLRTEPSERKTEEARRLFALLRRTDAAAVFAGPAGFLFPVEGGWRSAGFGDRRRYVYVDGSSERSLHEGLDWAVVEGTAVRACARGKVVLTAWREVTGGTVVVEHLPGLYSLYFHLSSIEVEDGAIVERGSVIARSGASGMATGPHLHWELRAGGEAVDPEYLLGVPLLDKEAVTAIMDGLIEGR